MKQTHIIKGPVEGHNFDGLIFGSGFKELNQLHLEGITFKFKPEKDFSVRLKIYKMYCSQKEVNILGQLFESDANMNDLNFWHIEMSSRCSDNDLNGHCMQFLDFKRKFDHFVELKPTSRTNIVGTT